MKRRRALLAGVLVVASAVLLVSRVGIYLRELPERPDPVSALRKIFGTTFQEYGFPPTPWRIDLPPAVEATFYRGNCERGSGLFNNGNYQTCAFFLSFRDDHGKVIRPGDPVSGESLNLHLRIDRSPNTLPGHFNKETMGTCFLTADPTPVYTFGEPLPDRVNFRTIRDMWEWEASFPIGAFPAGENAELKGTVYICSESSYPGDLGKRGKLFRQGMVYDLRMEAGRLRADSDLWMGSLYPPDRLYSRLPYEEWLSARPLPIHPPRESN